MNDEELTEEDINRLYEMGSKYQTEDSMGVRPEVNVTRESTNEVSPSVSEGGGTGLNLDFKNNDSELSAEDIENLKELEDWFSEESVNPVLSEEEKLSQDLEELEAEAEKRKQRNMQKRRLRELKGQVRRAKVENAVAPLSDRLKQAQDFVSGLNLGSHGSQEVAFGGNRQGFSLGKNKFDMGFNRNDNFFEKKNSGVSPSVKSRGSDGLLSKRKPSVVSFNARRGGLDWGSKKKQGIGFKSHKDGSGLSLSALSKNKLSVKKSGSGVLDLNLVMKRR